MPANSTPLKAVARILCCLIAPVFLLGATSRVDSILDIPEGTTIDFEVETCGFGDCFSLFDMMATPPDIGFTHILGEIGTEDAPFGGVVMRGDDSPFLFETLGRPWEAFGLTARSFFTGAPFTRTRLRALDEQGEELGQVSLALFGSAVRFVGIASDVPIHAIEISGLVGWDNIRFLPAAGAIEIDIKPGSPQNTINLRSEGVLSAAILGSRDFDVLDVVLDTVTLAGAAVRRQGESEAPLCHVRPVNHDEWPDLLCLFETAQMSLPEGLTHAIMRATTSNGDSFRGRDLVRIVPERLDEPTDPPGEEPTEAPRIESVSLTAEPTVATCDFTDYFLDWRHLCDASPILLGPLMVESTYPELRIEVAVTDPQSTPGSSDIRVVAASFSRRPSQDDFILLFDDGSSDVSGSKQKDFLNGEDCFVDLGQQICTCNVAFYEVNSHDAVADDDHFTGVEPMVDGVLLQHFREGLMLDCIAMQNQLEGFVRSDLADRSFDFRIEAVDQAGNLTEWPDFPSALIEPSSLTCSGDPCACCLLLNVENPGDTQENGGCRDLDGLMFDPDAMFCQGGPGRDPALFGNACMTDSECDGATGNGRCRVGPFNRVCPGGLCKSTRCLRP